MKRVLLAVAVVGLLGVGWLVYQLRSHPDIEPYEQLYLHARPAPNELRVTYLGVSTLLIEDGKTAIMTDGFFSRPGLAELLLTRVEPNLERIERHLAQAGVDRLAAVIVVHSHYDHAMDAPEVARRTGAMLVGSESTANVGRGWGLPENRLAVVAGERTFEYGDFRVTLIPSRHMPHGVAMGDIDEPLEPPAYASAYREGGSYSVFVEHEGRSLLVQGSAGFVEGQLADRQAEVVFLGIGGLGMQDPDYWREYWRQVVDAVDAERVIPIHWDDFTRPLGEPLVPFPRIADDFDATMRFLTERGQAEGVEIRLPPKGEPFDPFGRRSES